MSKRQEYDKKFTEAVQSIYQTARGIKTEDYGETWTRLGLLGLYVKIFIKEGRLNELIWKKQAQVNPQNESIKDTLIDIAAYAVYGIIALEEGNITGERPTEEHLKDMAAAINDRFECNKYGYKAITAFESKCNHCGKTFISKGLDNYCDKCKDELNNEICDKCGGSADGVR